MKPISFCGAPWSLHSRTQTEN